MSRSHLRTSLLFSIELIHALHPTAPRRELLTIRDFLLSKSGQLNLRKAHRSLFHCSRLLAQFRRQSSRATQLNFLTKSSRCKTLLDFLELKARDLNRVIFHQASLLHREYPGFPSSPSRPGVPLPALYRSRPSRRAGLTPVRRPNYHRNQVLRRLGNRKNGRRNRALRPPGPNPPVPAHRPLRRRTFQ